MNLITILGLINHFQNQISGHLNACTGTSDHDNIPVLVRNKDIGIRLVSDA